MRLKTRPKKHKPGESPYLLISLISFLKLLFECIAATTNTYVSLVSDVSLDTWESEVNENPGCLSALDCLSGWPPNTTVFYVLGEPK